jgi:hypothetical protein
VVTGKDANGNHAIVPAKPGAAADVTDLRAKPSVKPFTAADPSQQNTIVEPEVVAHVHPAGTATTETTNGAGETKTDTHFWKQPPSPDDRDGATTGAINLVVGAGNKGNASNAPTVYFFNSSGITCTESYKDFLLK